MSVSSISKTKVYFTFFYSGGKNGGLGLLII